MANITKKTVATGSIVPRREVQIKPQVSGIVEALYVEAGQQVKEGQLIARIRTVASAVNVNSAQTQIQAARIALQTSKTQLDRQQSLYDQKVIAQQDYQNYRNDYRAKQQQLDAAESNLQIAQRGASRNTGGSLNLVRSTITGLVLDVPVKVGSSVIERNNFNEGTTIAAVADMQSLVFEGKVDESEVGKVREGMPLNLTVGALENQVFPANLEYIAPKGVVEDGATKFLVRAKGAAQARPVPARQLLGQRRHCAGPARLGAGHPRKPAAVRQAGQGQRVRGGRNRPPAVPEAPGENRPLRRHQRGGSIRPEEGGEGEGSRPAGGRGEGVGKGLVLSFEG